MQSEKPKVFIGSSKESLELARAIQSNLDGDAWVTVWDQGIMQLSHSSWDSLIKGAWGSDFGIFVFSPNDLTQIRDKEVYVVRDNVILEFGLFTGKLGKERTFCVIPNNYDGNLHLPTDLLGLTAATYQACDPANPPSPLRGILGNACNQMRDAMKAAPPLPGANERRSALSDVLVEGIISVIFRCKDEIIEALKGHPGTLSPAGLTDSIDHSITIRDIEKLVSQGDIDAAEEMAERRLKKQPGNVTLVETYIAVLLKKDTKEKTTTAWNILKNSELKKVSVYPIVA